MHNNRNITIIKPKYNFTKRRKSRMKRSLLLLVFLLLTPITHAMSDVAAAAEYAQSDLKILYRLQGERYMYKKWRQYKKGVIQMIKKDPRNVNTNGEYNHCGDKYSYISIDTPLYLSVEYPDVDFTAYLLKLGANPNIPSWTGASPLYSTIQYIHWNLEMNDLYKAHKGKQILKLLIAYNANPDLVHKNRESPRELAYPSIRLLIEQAEHEKFLKECLLLMPCITKEPARIVAGYLNISSEFAQKTTGKKSCLVQ